MDTSITFDDNALAGFLVGIQDQDYERALKDAVQVVLNSTKVGYMEEGTIHETTAGVPQGGVISPLLFNIALHGAESVLGIRYNNWGQNRSKRAIVRYADDMVAFCESKEDAEEMVQILKDWLKERATYSFGRCEPRRTPITLFVMENWT